MKITLVGMGSGLPGSLTAQGLQALQTAGLILGAKRLLQNLPDGCTPNRKPIYLPDEVLACLQAEPCQTAALVYSGDTGFYSGAAALVPKLRAQGAEVTVLPGISSVQLLAAALGRPWQNWHPRMCLRPCGRVPERPPDLFFDGRAQYQPRRAV